MMKNKANDKGYRRIKVEEVGDFFRHRTKPFLRLSGNWLARAGIHPKAHVVVTNPAEGVLHITLEQDHTIE
jgi:hypothetical protein